MKFYRYFYRTFMDTLVGIVKANDIDDAKEKLKKSYTTCDIDRFDIEEVSFSKNDIIEVYYGG